MVTMWTILELFQCFRLLLMLALMFGCWQRIPKLVSGIGRAEQVIMEDAQL